MNSAFKIVVLLSLCFMSNSGYSQVRKVIFDSTNNYILKKEFSKAGFDCKTDILFLLYISMNDCFRCTAGRNIISKNDNLLSKTLLVVDYISDKKLGKFLRQYGLTNFKISKNKKLKTICRDLLSYKVQNTSFFSKYSVNSLTFKPLIQIHFKPLDFNNNLLDFPNIIKFNDTFFYQNIIDLGLNSNKTFSIIAPSSKLMSYDSTLMFLKEYRIKEKKIKLAYHTVLKDLHLPDSLNKVNNYMASLEAYDKYIKPLGLTTVKFEDILKISNSKITVLVYLSFTIHNKNTNDFNFSGRYFIIDFNIKTSAITSMKVVKYNNDSTKYFLPYFGFNLKSLNFEVSNFPRIIKDTTGYFYFKSKYKENKNSYSLSGMDSSFKLENKKYCNDFKNKFFSSKYAFDNINNKCLYFKNIPEVICANSFATNYLSGFKNVQVKYMKEIKDRIYVVLTIKNQSYFGVLNDTKSTKISLYPINTGIYFISNVYDTEKSIVFNLKNKDNEDYILKLAKSKLYANYDIFN